MKIHIQKKPKAIKVNDVMDIPIKRAYELRKLAFGAQNNTKTNTESMQLIADKSKNISELIYAIWHLGQYRERKVNSNRMANQMMGSLFGGVRPNQVFWMCLQAIAVIISMIVMIGALKEFSTHWLIFVINLAFLVVIFYQRMKN